MNIEEILSNLEKQKTAFQMLTDGYKMLSELPRDNPYCDADFIDKSLEAEKNVKKSDLLIKFTKDEITTDEFISGILLI